MNPPKKPGPESKGTAKLALRRHPELAAIQAAAKMQNSFQSSESKI
jgi:hypothetical protein